MARRIEALFSLLRRLSGVFAIRAGEVGIRYAFTLVLAMKLSVEGVGRFYLGFAIITLAAAMARFGVDSVAMRQVAVARAMGDAALARGVAAFALGGAALAGGAVSAMLFLAAPFLATRLLDAPGFLPELRVFAFGTLALAVLTTAGSLLNALDRPGQGQAVPALAWPLLAAAWLLLGGGEHAAAGAVLAMAAAALAGVALVGHALGRGAVRPAAARTLLGGAAPLFGVEMTHLLLAHLPLLALGFWATEAEAGLFALAGRIATLLTALTVAMYAVAAPRMARLHAAGDAAGLERAAHEATRGVMALALPAAAAMLLFPGGLLALFGAEFRAGAPLLVILALGQLVNAQFSQCPTLLAMSGHERWLLRCAIAALGVMGLALALLVPALGPPGAALAAATAIAAMSLGCAIGVRRRLGLNVLRAWAIVGVPPLMRRRPWRRAEMPK